MEADTDGVYFAVPPGWTMEDERRAVAEVGALLPALVQLEFEGRYAAMLSHEPKNYALLGYDGRLVLRGVAFRSSRAEPFGERFLRCAILKLLVEDIPGVRAAYLETLDALEKRALSCYEVSSAVRLTKSVETYLETRESRRELPYEAMLAHDQRTWSIGDRVRVYRTKNGAALVEDGLDSRDYDVQHYARLLRETYAFRLVRAFTPEDWAAVFAQPGQLSLFAPDIATIRTILQPMQS